MTVTFDRKAAFEDMLTTARYFKHLDFERVIRDGKVMGFKFDLKEFNAVIFNGKKQQVRKKCKSTQTDSNDETVADSGTLSPSIFSKDFKKMYN